MARYNEIDLSGAFGSEAERPEPSVNFPVYTKIRESPEPNLWIIRCNEGWRSSVVCGGMYEWAADWLLKVIDGRPFATKERP